MRGSLVVLAMALGASTGCAAIFKGGKQDVVFEGVPQGADVRVNGAYAGSLPTATARIDRDKVPNIVVSAEGFKEQYIHLEKKPDTPWWFWDVATCVVPVTLCIPVLVDAISGAWYSYDDRYAVKLVPLPTAPRQLPRHAPTPDEFISPPLPPPTPTTEPRASPPQSAPSEGP